MLDLAQGEYAIQLFHHSSPLVISDYGLEIAFLMNAIAWRCSFIMNAFGGWQKLQVEPENNLSDLYGVDGKPFVLL